MNLTVEGTAPRGQKKTWRKTVNKDMKLKGLKVDCMNRPRWRKGLRRTMSLESESEPEQDQPYRLAVGSVYCVLSMGT